MKIRCGSFDVLDSGVVVSPSMEDTEFTIQESPLMILVFRIKKNASDQPAIELTLEADSRLVITYTNPAVQLNFGSQEPINLGSMGGRTLYGVLRTTVIGDYSSYQLTYSFFLEEEQK